MPTSQDLEQSENLRVLFHMPEWKSFAAMATALSEKWKSNLLRIDHGFSAEQIALERVRWAAQIEGSKYCLWK